MDLLDLQKDEKINNKIRSCMFKCHMDDYNFSTKSDMVEEGKMVGLDGTVLQDLFNEVITEDDLSIRQWVPRPLQ